jgi:hypothetical protein
VHGSKSPIYALALQENQHYFLAINSGAHIGQIKTYGIIRKREQNEETSGVDWKTNMMRTAVQYNGSTER